MVPEAEEALGGYVDASDRSDRPRAGPCHMRRRDACRGVAHVVSHAAGLARSQALVCRRFEAGCRRTRRRVRKIFGKQVDSRVRDSGCCRRPFQKGEAADVVIASGAQIDELQKQGKVVPGSRVDIAKVGLGVFVRKGSAKPDLSSVEGFTRSLSTAKAIVYVDPASGAASGIYIASLLDRLGLAAEMQPKTKLSPSPDAPLYESVASGEADLGFSLITEILAQPSVELAGPLPSAIQKYTQFAAGITRQQQPDAGKALVTFLSSPAAQAVLRTKGFE